MTTRLAADGTGECNPCASQTWICEGGDHPHISRSLPDLVALYIVRKAGKPANPKADFGNVQTRSEHNEERRRD